MVLTGLEIINQIELGNIFISDFDKTRVNPNSYNLRLHNELKVYNKVTVPEHLGSAEAPQGLDFILDMKKQNKTTTIIIPEDGLILYPNILYLGRTLEMTRTNGFVPQIEGRSSIARLGIDIHKTAGWGDDGFENYWTLEIVATHPVKIYPFVEFCQIIYMKTFGDNSIKYKGKYQKTNGIDVSKIYEEFNNPIELYYCDNPSHVAKFVLPTGEVICREKDTIDFSRVQPFIGHDLVLFVSCSVASDYVKEPEVKTLLSVEIDKDLSSKYNKNIYYLHYDKKVL
jgi:dCTP deaminase